MTSKLESHFQHKYLVELRAIPNSYFFVKEAASLRGIPDVIGVINGRFVALELKRSEKEARKKTGRIVLQRHVLSLMRKAGAFAEIVYPENSRSILLKLREL